MSNAAMMASLAAAEGRETFEAVWEALEQYVQNNEDAMAVSDDLEMGARTEAARKVMEAFEAKVAALVEG